MSMEYRTWNKTARGEETLSTSRIHVHTYIRNNQVRYRDELASPHICIPHHVEFRQIHCVINGKAKQAIMRNKLRASGETARSSLHRQKGSSLTLTSSFAEYIQSNDNPDISAPGVSSPPLGEKINYSQTRFSGVVKKEREGERENGRNAERETEKRIAC